MWNRLKNKRYVWLTRVLSRGMRKCGTIVGEVEFDELRKKYDSFDKLLKFLER